jgi:sugar phosphate isomerase/epimerase
MTISDMLEYCSRQGFDAVDLTGYYFTGYPAVPSDEVIYNVKRKAFLLGIEIGGTGVRNDFTWADSEKRKVEKQLVKDWVIVAEKLGAPEVRIFAGNQPQGNIPWDERAKWVAEDVRECAEFGKKHGVMMALQNHNDFLKTSEEVEKIMKMIDSDWTGLMLDIGSYHSADPYADIAKNVKHAISWQLKEKVFVNDNQVDTDYVKVMDIVKRSGYKGFLPLETLGEGDPEEKVEALLKKVRNVLNINI